MMQIHQFDAHHQIIAVFEDMVHGLLHEHKELQLPGKTVVDAYEPSPPDYHQENAIRH